MHGKKFRNLLKYFTSKHRKVDHKKDGRNFIGNHSFAVTMQEDQPLLFGSINIIGQMEVLLIDISFVSQNSAAPLNCAVC